MDLKNLGCKKEEGKNQINGHLNNNAWYHAAFYRLDVVPLLVKYGCATMIMSITLLGAQGLKRA